MRTLTEQLASYATYHRDRRNVATHLLGIPAIVLAIMTLLARPFDGLLVWAAVALAALFYLRLDLEWGLVMSGIFALFGLAGLALAAGPLTVWLAVGLSLFIGGWALQFLGHWFEGRKPAFIDDLAGLLIGPLFVTAELAFAMGLCGELQAQLDARI